MASTPTRRRPNQAMMMAALTLVAAALIPRARANNLAIQAGLGAENYQSATSYRSSIVGSQQQQQQQQQQFMQQQAAMQQAGWQQLDLEKIKNMEEHMSDESPRFKQQQQHQQVINVQYEQQQTQQQQQQQMQQNQGQRYSGQRPSVTYTDGSAAKLQGEAYPSAGGGFNTGAWSTPQIIGSSSASASSPSSQSSSVSYIDASPPSGGMSNGYGQHSHHSSQTAVTASSGYASSSSSSSGMSPVYTNNDVRYTDEPPVRIEQIAAGPAQVVSLGGGGMGEAAGRPVHHTASWDPTAMRRPLAELKQQGIAMGMSEVLGTGQERDLSRINNDLDVQLDSQRDRRVGYSGQLSQLNALKSQIEANIQQTRQDLRMLNHGATAAAASGAPAGGVEGELARLLGISGEAASLLNNNNNNNNAAASEASEGTSMGGGRHHRHHRSHSEVEQGNQAKTASGGATDLLSKKIEELVEAKVDAILEKKASQKIEDKKLRLRSNHSKTPEVVEQELEAVEKFIKGQLSFNKNLLKSLHKQQIDADTKNA